MGYKQEIIRLLEKIDNNVFLRKIYSFIKAFAEV